MLQLLSLLLHDKTVNSTIFKFFNQVKNHITLLTYLLPCQPMYQSRVHDM